MTVYRNKDALGLFITLAGPAGVQAFESLEADASALEAEVGLALTFTRQKEMPFKGTISTIRPLAKFGSTAEPELRAWLAAAANRMVNAFRPRLAKLGRELATSTA